jgi:hypothetical protein
MSYLHEELRSEFESTVLAYRKDTEKYPVDFWKWAVKNKGCKIEYYISSLDDSGREDQTYFKTRKSMLQAWKEMKPINYDMKSYKCLTMVTDEQEDLIDDEIIDSYYNEEADENN